MSESHDTTSGDDPRGPLRWYSALGLLAVIVGSGVVVAAFLVWWNEPVGTASKAAGKVLACVPDRAHMSESKCPPAGTPYIEGLVGKSQDGVFTMRVLSSGGTYGKSKTLYVRKPDRQYIDVAHAQTHAALGQPVRVYFKKVDGKDAVIYMEDAPLLN